MPKPRIDEIILRMLEVPELPITEKVELLKRLADIEELKLRHSHELAISRAKKKAKSVYLVESKPTESKQEAIPEQPEVPIGVQVGNILEKLKQTGSGTEVVSGETNGSGQPNQSS